MARYEANADFQRDYYKRRKLAGRSPGNDDEVSIICFPHKLNIVLEDWKGLRTRLVYLMSNIHLYILYHRRRKQI